MATPHGAPFAMPLVHMNGTSRQELQQQWARVRLAAHTLDLALREAEPHGRDYVPVNQPHFARAVAEHRALRETVRAIYERTELMLLHLTDF